MERKAGSYIVGEDGKLEPNLDDEAMKQRHKTKEVKPEAKKPIEFKKRGGK